MRDRWDSRSVFLFAAIGSAVGLGNVWRFPYLAYKFGGGAFLIPYGIALFIIGIPLLILELMLGQKFQSGGVEAFRKMNRRFEGIGVASILTSFIIVSYYAVVMAWMLVYFIRSFGSPLPWIGDSKGYFFGEVLQLSSSIDHLGGLNLLVFFSLIFVWVCIYFCVWKGVKSAEKVVRATAPIPVIILIILFIRGITLDGSLKGILYYVSPDFTLLVHSEIWLAAASQIFFTLSLAVGVMIAYASYNKPNQDVKKDALIIAFSNSFISLFAGLVVFSILGYMTTVTGTSIREVATSGPGLAFVVFPEALSVMPAPIFFSVLFFLMLLTLGIDSAFSLIESVNTALSDRFPSLSKPRIAMFVCTWSFCCGIIYSTNAGLYFLDVIDHFVVEFGLVFLGLLQCLAVGWGYGANKLRLEFNAMGNSQLGIWWTYAIKYVIPITLTVLLVEQSLVEASANYGGFPSWAIAMAIGVTGLPFLFVLKSLLKPKKDR
ncbi:MAG: NSS family neurotransmitter:Na+ symporter, partial [Halioglobus sp.]